MEDWGCGSWVVAVVLLVVGLVHLNDPSAGHLRVGWVCVGIAVLLFVMGGIASILHYARAPQAPPEEVRDGD